MGRFYSLHGHSNYSRLDAIPTVALIVAKSVDYGYPAVALTDHGTLAGAVQLYQAAAKHNVPAFIGMECYLLDPDASLAESKANRFHVGLTALDLDGYRAIKDLNNLAHTRPRFSRFPRITVEDLVDVADRAAEHVVLTTGCYFGLVVQHLVNKGPSEALGAVRTYASLFPHTYVELMHHNIDHGDGYTDSDIVSELVSIADQLGLPVLATQDNHYLNESDKRAHTLMKRMVYSNPDEGFPGDSYHVASEEWIAEHYDANVWSSVLGSCDELLNMNKLAMPALDTYKPRIPFAHPRPLSVLTAMVLKGLHDMGKLTSTRYRRRVDYELGVIEKMNDADYFILVRKFQQKCKARNVLIEVRGSANGSLVLYALGVTSVDPIKWGLSFDRFLSVDRIKPPDVDIDIEDAEHEWAIRELQRMFPGAVRIGTHGKLGITFDDEGHERGSVVVTYKSYLMDTAAKAVPEIEGEKKYELEVRRKAAKTKWGWVQNIDDVRRINPRDYADLRRLDAYGSVLKNYGAHAGGVLLPGADLPIEDYVPLALIPSGAQNTVTQWDQDDVEEFGYTKLDILGQKSLTTMRKCQQLMGRDNPTDFGWIPEDDTETCAFIRAGRTNTGLFHYETPSKANGARRMKIRTINDVILGTALFMPGPNDVPPGHQISQADLYLARRFDKHAKDTVTYLHPVFEKALRPTYGAVIYQDQVLQIVRGLGMSIASANKFLKVLKDSGKGSTARNAKRLAEVRAEFNELCAAEGIDADEAWAETASFAAYGFGKAHATGYGIRAYRMAYLRVHHTWEYMTALLMGWVGEKKEIIYEREARRCGIRILPADVQTSGASWSMDKRYDNPVIRRALVSIPHVGRKAALSIEVNQPFASIEDLIERTDARQVTGGKSYLTDGTLNGVLGHLRSAGALDSLAGKRATS